MEYILIESNKDSQSLAQKVREAIELGFEPLGGPSITRLVVPGFTLPQFFGSQAMIRQQKKTP